MTWTFLGNLLNPQEENPLFGILESWNPERGRSKWNCFGRVKKLRVIRVITSHYPFGGESNLITKMLLVVLEGIFVLVHCLGWWPPSADPWLKMPAVWGVPRPARHGIFGRNWKVFNSNTLHMRLRANLPPRWGMAWSDWRKRINLWSKRRWTWLRTPVFFSMFFGVASVWRYEYVHIMSNTHYPLSYPLRTR